MGDIIEKAFATSLSSDGTVAVPNAPAIVMNVGRG